MDGDRLPQSALAKLGSSRWQHRGNQVSGLVFSDDGETLYAGDWLGLTAFEVATGDVRWRHHNTDSSGLAIVSHPKGPRLVSVGMQGRAHFFDATTGAWLGKVGLELPFAYNLNAVTASRADMSFLVVGQGGIARLVSSDGKHITTLDLSTNQHNPSRAVIAPDGRTAVVLALRAWAGLWSLDEGKLLRTFPHRGMPPTAACFSPDGSTLYLGMESGEIVEFDPATGDERGRWQAHAAAVWHLAVSRDGASLYSLGDRESLVRWAVATRVGLASQVVSCFNAFFALSPDERWVAFSDGRRVKLASADDLSLVPAAKVTPIEMNGVAVSRTGPTVAVLSTTEVYWCDPETLTVASSSDIGLALPALGIHRLPEGDRVAYRRYLSDGWQCLDLAARRVESLDLDDDNHWWGTRAEASSRKRKVTLHAPVGGDRVLKGTIAAVAFSPDDATAYFLSGKKLIAWDTAQHVERWSAAVPTPRSVVVSPNGEEVLVEGYLKHHRFRADGQGKPVVHGLPDAAIASLAVYAPDSRLLAVGAYSEVALIDCTTHAMVGWLNGHHAALSGLAFSPDGTKLYTASQDGTAIVWSVTEALKAGVPTLGFETKVASKAKKAKG